MADSNAKKLAQFLTSSGTYNLYDVQADSTGFFDLPTGTTAQRPSPTGGMIRFNSTLNLAEYYDGTSWKSIDSPPTVSSASPSYFDAEGDTITVTGDNFQTGVTVKLIGADATEYAAASVTRNSATELTFDITAAMVTDNDPFDIQVTNLNGLAGTLAAGVEIASNPTFTTSTGTYVVYDAARGSYSFDASATTVDSDDTLSYAVTAGSLPTGASINSSTGAITGFSAVGSDTSSTFTVTATATSAETSDTYTATRQWTITVAAPTITSYTSTGSGSFSVPTGVTAVDVLVIAGGGSGATNGGDGTGGGGAGGLIYRPAYPVTPQGTISYSVGAGGTSVPSGNTNGNNGQDSTFGGLTAKGGGYGGTDSANAGGPGGSGGGAGVGGQNNGNPGGTGTQPQQPGDSGTYGFGNAGGSIGNAGMSPGGSGGGGGGAGGTGGSGGEQANAGGTGGNGKSYSISGSPTIYAGGGGGASWTGTQGVGGPGGGGAGASRPQSAGAGQGTNGLGAGGGGSTQNGTSGRGGSGIVIVKY